MKQNFFFYFLLLLFEQMYSYYIDGLGDQIKHLRNRSTISNFVFGSCFGSVRPTQRDDIFKTILKNEPDLFIWVGDAQYTSSPFTKELTELSFNKTFNNKCTYQIKIDYKEMRLKTPIIGTWDDHDYGRNDGNTYFKYKNVTKELYLDFLEEPLSSIRREPGRGIYETYSFGQGHQSVRIILLDIRYHKSLYFSLWEERDMLGEEQWKWLENIINNSTETFIFIVSGTQILPIDRFVTEAWYIESRERLFKMIEGKSGVVFLS
jgi:alkaline phosphatase D